MKSHIITHDEVNPRFGTVKLDYKPADLLLAQKIQELTNRLMSKAAIDAEVALIPQGGVLIVHIRRPTIESADTECFEFVLIADDEERIREIGEPCIPEVPPEGSDMWWNIHVLALQDPITSRAEFYVMDTLLGGRDKFTIARRS